MLENKHRRSRNLVVVSPLRIGQRLTTPSKWTFFVSGGWYLQVLTSPGMILQVGCVFLKVCLVDDPYPSLIPKTKRTIKRSHLEFVDEIY